MRTRLVLAAVLALSVVALPQTQAESSAASEFDVTGVWSEVPSATPPPRFNAAMVYDAARDEVVLFGGCCHPDSEMNDTWIWDGQVWAQRHTPVAPSARESSTMVYDAVREEVVLFGGLDFFSGEPLGDTWVWDGRTWTERTPAVSPPRRYSAAGAYDADRGEVVLFGGCCDETHPVTTFAGLLGDTWTWDGQTWHQEETVLAPPGRRSAAMAYDAARGETVLFGGSCAVCGEPTGMAPGVASTWVWDGEAWSMRQPDTSPSSKVQASMAYDAARELVVLFGGSNSTETWTWDGQDWTQRQPSVAPPRRQAAAMAYDAGDQRMVLFGGYSFTVSELDEDGTWTWDGTTWSEVPRMWPEYRWGAGMALDPARGEVVLFGGLHFVTPMDDTWTWDGATWTRHAVEQAPPPRYWTSMAHHAPTGQMVLFGGLDGSGKPLDDTWSWDGQTWMRHEPATSPPARRGATLAADPVTGDLVLFGGFDGNYGGGTAQGDTWVWDGQTWTAHASDPAPPPRGHASMAADPSRGTIVLFGGVRGGETLGDTWTWQDGTWTQRHPAAAPPARMRASMGHDDASEQVILFGGNRNDTWAWDGTSWTEQDAGHEGHGRRAERPSQRADASAAPNPTGGLLVFGGDRPGPDGHDLWLWQPPAARVTVSADGFAPQTVEVAQGGTVRWDVEGDAEVLDGSGMGLFGSPGSPAGSSGYAFSFTTAGTYEVVDPTSGRTGTVAVPLDVATDGTDVVVRWSQVRPPVGYVVDVEVRRPGASGFVDSLMATRDGAARFTPEEAGDYAFRVRLRNSSNGAVTAWSPVAVIAS